MPDKKRLFAYDWDGTIVAPIFALYALHKRENPDSKLTFAEFREKNKNIPKAIVNGMVELIRYTATLGQNVLISGGDPVGDAEHSPEMKELLSYFQPWEHEGSAVPFGKEPQGLVKENPQVAESLLKAFSPSEVIVVGDSISECELAKNMAATVLLLRTNLATTPAGYETIPHRHIAQTGLEMKKILEQHFGARDRFRSRPQARRLRRPVNTIS